MTLSFIIRASRLYWLRIELAGVLAEQRWHVQPRHDRNLADLGRFARLRVLQLPPPSADRSTITAPAFIPATCFLLMSFGDGRPGMAAAV